eukprot:TRINITY_DN25748_c0_g1_i1.p1 TRINITY_DN25748_c0_g1~~TRINITY_DN25748_c0_g1_i1.p1  ORF type:complete len:266 (-),score=55.96 TRINITY_DN25748_c0_g1_i1:33-830(-)
MIGGNPCQPQFYEEFIRAVHRNGAGAMECRVMGHCGHDSSGELNQGAVFSLEQQLEFHAAYLRSRLDGDRELGVVLCGHSVGAYIVLKLLRLLKSSHENHRVLRAILLFPTIMEIAATPNGRLQQRSLRWRKTYAAFVGGVSYLPRCVRHSLIRKTQDGLETQEDVDAADEFVSFNAVNNALYMCGTEFEDIRELDADTLRAHADRTLVYFGATDDWAPLSHRDEILRQVPEARVVVDELGARRMRLDSSSARRLGSCAGTNAAL